MKLREYLRYDATIWRPFLSGERHRGPLQPYPERSVVRCARERRDLLTRYVGEIAAMNGPQAAERDLPVRELISAVIKLLP